ncbi:DUF1453 family protein [Alicyclobacillus curvatus]|jgi:membrane protein CcdC involved in cytochrome C biogenesis|nr:DUF1453 family protein [Alicyclobacillus curvatus]
MIVNTSHLVTTLVIVLIILFVIARQLFPKRVTRMTLYGLPILAAYGAIRSLPYPTIPPSEVVEAAVTILLSMLAGYLQTRDTKLIQRPDGIYYRGGWIYVTTWFGLLIARFLVEISFQGIQGVTNVSSHEWILYLDVAIAWGMRSLMLVLRHPEILTEVRRQRAARRG